MSPSSSVCSTPLLSHYSLLIAPVEAYLRGSDDLTPRLIIIPHDFLFVVPFAALQNPEGKILIEEFILSYAPSLSILHLLTQKACSSQPGEGNTPFIIGNPLMPHPEIDQLLGAEEEAISVHCIMGGDLYLKEGATKRTVMNNLPHHSIIHLATHALLGDSVAEHLEAVQTNSNQDGDYTVKGAIVLGRSDATCSGILTSHEVQALDLSCCQMITLSCCRTACGKVTGDGILGLSRALLIAGAMCLVTALWAIEDRPTARLMCTFYMHYKNSRDAPLAMRSAMLSLISEGFASEQWAAFCVSGVSPGMVESSTAGEH